MPVSPSQTSVLPPGNRWAPETLAEKKASRGSEWRPVLWIRSDSCDPGPVVACESGRAGWTTLSEVFEPGSYTLVVDGTDEDQAGDYLLRQALEPAE